MTPALPNYSPSAAENFHLCQRRWWFDKVLKLPREADDTLSWGTAVHYVLENYLRDGRRVAPGVYVEGRDTIVVTPDHIKRAESAFRHLPQPGTWKVELWIPTLHISGMKVAGKVDLYNPDDAAIMDHKSTKTINETGPWAVTPTRLRTNAQGLFYAGALIRTGVFERGSVKFAHNYVQREGPVRSKLVRTEFELPQIDDAWGRSTETAAAMVKVVQTVPGDLAAQGDVAYDTGACNAFNRPCPYMAVCNANTRRGLGALVRDLDTIRATPNPGGPVGIFDKFKSPVTPAAQAAPKPPVAAITPPDARAVGKELVQAAFMEECRDVLALVTDSGGATLSWAEVRELLTAEHLPAEFHPNIAAAIGADLPAQYEHLRAVPQDALLAGWPNTADSFTEDTSEGAVAAGAAALLEVPARVAADIATELPPAVREAAIEAAIATGATEHAAALAAHEDSILEIITAHADNPITAKAATTVYRALTNGDYARATEADLDDALRGAGRQRVRDAHRAAVLEVLLRIPTLGVQHGVATLRGESAAPADVKPAPDSPAPQPAVVPETVPPPPADAPKPEPAPAVVNVAPAPTAAVMDVAPAPTSAPTSPQPFVLVIGAAVRGVATTEFADIPWIQRALRKIKDRIESSTGEDYRAFNNFGTTWLASVVPEFSRSQASGEELPGGWYWLDRYDPLADAKAGLRTWVKESGGVVIG